MFTQRIKRRLLRTLESTLLFFAPERKRLPIRFWIHKLSGGCEEEIRHLHRIISDRGTAIDIGANTGLYTYVMARHFSKVIAFEINDGLTRELAVWNPGNITIIAKGLSSCDGDAVLHIPVVNGNTLTGWASLDPHNCPDAQYCIEKPVTLTRLDSFELPSVSFIKIDVEGHELEVLKGAASTLARSRPICLVEVKAQNQAEVVSFMTAQNYEMKTLAELIGVSGSQENRFFIPCLRS